MRFSRYNDDGFTIIQPGPNLGLDRTQQKGVVFVRPGQVIRRCHGAPGAPVRTKRRCNCHLSYVAGNNILLVLPSVFGSIKAASPMSLLHLYRPIYRPNLAQRVYQRLNGLTDRIDPASRSEGYFDEVLVGIHEKAA